MVYLQPLTARLKVALTREHPYCSSAFVKPSPSSVARATATPYPGTAPSDYAIGLQLCTYSVI